MFLALACVDRWNHNFQLKRPDSVLITGLIIADKAEPFACEFDRVRSKMSASTSAVLIGGKNSSHATRNAVPSTSSSTEDQHVGAAVVGVEPAVVKKPVRLNMLARRVQVVGRCERRSSRSWQRSEPQEQRRAEPDADKHRRCFQVLADLARFCWMLGRMVIGEGTPCLVRIWEALLQGFAVERAVWGFG